MHGIRPRRQFLCPRCSRRCESLFARDDALLCRLCAHVRYQSPLRRAELQLARMRHAARRIERAAMQAATLTEGRPDVSRERNAPVSSDTHFDGPPLADWGNNNPPACPTPLSAETAIEDARRVHDLVDKRRESLLRRIRASRVGL
jgi:hypothetical protein